MQSLISASQFVVLQVGLTNQTQMELSLQVGFQVFYTLSDLIKEEDKKLSTLELPERIDFTNKKDPQDSQFSNDGNDEAVLACQR